MKLFLKPISSIEELEQLLNSLPDDQRYMVMTDELLERKSVSLEETYAFWQWYESAGASFPIPQGWIWKGQYPVITAAQLKSARHRRHPRWDMPVAVGDPIDSENLPEDRFVLLWFAIELGPKYDGLEDSQSMAGDRWKEIVEQLKQPTLNEFWDNLNYIYLISERAEKEAWPNDNPHRAAVRAAKKSMWWDGGPRGKVARTTISHKFGGLQEEEPAPSNVSQQIATYFDKEEIKTMCWGLGIDFENLPGEGKKATEVINYCFRHGLTEELVTTLCQLRPNVQWLNLPTKRRM